MSHHCDRFYYYSKTKRVKQIDRAIIIVRANKDWHCLTERIPLKTNDKIITNLQIWQRYTLVLAYATMDQVKKIQQLPEFKFSELTISKMCTQRMFCSFKINVYAWDQLHF